MPVCSASKRQSWNSDPGLAARGGGQKGAGKLLPRQALLLAFEPLHWLMCPIQTGVFSGPEGLCLPVSCCFRGCEKPCKPSEDGDGALHKFVITCRCGQMTEQKMEEMNNEDCTRALKARVHTGTSCPGVAGPGAPKLRPCHYNTKCRVRTDPLTETVFYLLFCTANGPGKFSKDNPCDKTG